MAKKTEEKEVVTMSPASTDPKYLTEELIKNSRDVLDVEKEVLEGALHLYCAKTSTPISEIQTLTVAQAKELISTFLTREV